MPWRRYSKSTPSSCSAMPSSGSLTGVAALSAAPVGGGGEAAAAAAAAESGASVAEGGPAAAACRGASGWIGVLVLTLLLPPCRACRACKTAAASSSAAVNVLPVSPPPLPPPLRARRQGSCFPPPLPAPTCRCRTGCSGSNVAMRNPHSRPPPSSPLLLAPSWAASAMDWLRSTSAGRSLGLKP